MTGATTQTIRNSKGNRSMAVHLDQGRGGNSSSSGKVEEGAEGSSFRAAEVSNSPVDSAFEWEAVFCMSALLGVSGDALEQSGEVWFSGAVFVEVNYTKVSSLRSFLPRTVIPSFHVIVCLISKNFPSSSPNALRCQNPERTSILLRNIKQ